MARNLPSSAQLDGFDNNLSQCPPKEWLPDNVNIYNFDAFAKLPKELTGRYDILHVRLFLLIVQNDDPMPLLKTFIQMLSAYNHHSLSIDELVDPLQTLSLTDSHI